MVIQRSERARRLEKNAGNARHNRGFRGAGAAPERRSASGRAVSSRAARPQRPRLTAVLGERTGEEAASPHGSRARHHAARAHARGPQSIIRQARQAADCVSMRKYHHSTISPGDMVLSPRPGRYSAAGLPVSMDCNAGSTFSALPDSRAIRPTLGRFSSL